MGRPMYYGAYEAVVDEAEFDVRGLGNSRDLHSRYTTNPYDQPAVYHRAIALLDAASGDDRFIDLEGVGQRQVYPSHDRIEIDYYISTEFLYDNQ